MADPFPTHVGPVRVPRLGVGAGAPVQAVLLCLPTPLAGGGTERQLEQAWEGLSALLAGTAVRLHLVAPPAAEGAHPAFVSPSVPIEPVAKGDVPGTYHRVTAAFSRALGELHAQGARRVLVLCMGYTAYGPEGVKRALASLSASGKRMEATVWLVDSAYPDLDGEDRRTGPDGWPLGRFFADAYAAAPNLSAAFLLTSAYAYDPMILNARAPAGLSGVAVIAPPYTDAYVARIEEIGRRGKAERGRALASLLPGLAERRAGDLLIPLVASDIWSPDAVGVWMTREQHETCLVGTASILRTLRLVAAETGQRVFVPIDRAGADLAAGQGLPDTVVLREMSAPVPADARLIVSAYRGIPQDDHAYLLGAADLAVSRTGGQANATVVLALAGTPNLVIDLPARGYMQSELTSWSVTHAVTVDATGKVDARPRPDPLGWLGRWDWAPERLAARVHEILAAPDEVARRTAAARTAFFALRGSLEGSLLRRVARLAGIE